LIGALDAYPYGDGYTQHPFPPKGTAPTIMSRTKSTTISVKLCDMVSLLFLHCEEPVSLLNLSYASWISIETVIRAEL
jgi:hypothetical protein